MPHANRHFDDKCIDRATTIQRGEVVELSIDVGGYRALVEFNEQSYEVTAAAVESRPVRRPLTVPDVLGDEDDHESGVDQWEAAGSFVGKATSLGKAVWSKWKYGPLTGAKLDYRVQSCFGETMAGVPVGTPCPSLVVKDGNSFCKSCGCGTKHKRAQLNPQVAGDYETSKLAYPDLDCPRDRFVPWKGDE